jgi:S1-C subfamily serine protease
MKTTAYICVLALAALLLTPTAIAGEHGHKKCNEDTENCLTAMVAKIESKGWLGIETEKADYGYRITRVVDNSPAATYGLQEGDVLVALNGVRLSEDNKDELSKIKKSLGPGVQAKYTVKRDGGKAQVAVTLGTVPADVMAEWVGRHMIQHHAETQIASN